MIRRPVPADLVAPLRAWLPGQRWFQGKARTVAGIEIADAAVLSDTLLDVLVDVRYDDGGSERYQVPLLATDDDGPGFRDALADADACRRLAALVTFDATVPTLHGRVLSGLPVTGEAPASDEPPRLLRAEQSNSSVVFGDRLILKVLRRLEAGVHPDVELTRGLTQAGFGHVPAQHGSCELRDGEGEPTALAVLTDFVAGGREGWDLATAEVAAILRGEGQTDLLLPHVEALGAAVAGMHTTLADVFGAAHAGPGELRAWSTRMLAQAERVLDLAARRAATAAAPVLARAAEVRTVLADVAGLDAGGPMTRVHGDLHLGQALLDRHGIWQLLDFEGEPAKSMAERRQPGSPLRDVAGMLRSFDYAVGQGLRQAGHDPAGSVPPAAEDWYQAARRRFLAGYLRAAIGLLPATGVAERLLAAFELDKAVYELGYELANRPDWVMIPVGGILRVLGGHGSGRDTL